MATAQNSPVLSNPHQNPAPTRADFGALAFETFGSSGGWQRLGYDDLVAKLEDAVTDDTQILATLAIEAKQRADDRRLARERDRFFAAAATDMAANRDIEPTVTAMDCAPPQVRPIESNKAEESTRSAEIIPISPEPTTSLLLQMLLKETEDKPRIVGKRKRRKAAKKAKARTQAPAAEIVQKDTGERTAVERPQPEPVVEEETPTKEEPKKLSLREQIAALDAEIHTEKNRKRLRKLRAKRIDLQKELDNNGKPKPKAKRSPEEIAKLKAARRREYGFVCSHPECYFGQNAKQMYLPSVNALEEMLGEELSTDMQVFCNQVDPYAVCRRHKDEETRHPVQSTFVCVVKRADARQRRAEEAKSRPSKPQPKRRSNGPGTGINARKNAELTPEERAKKRAEQERKKRDKSEADRALRLRMQCSKGQSTPGG